MNNNESFILGWYYSENKVKPFAGTVKHKDIHLVHRGPKFFTYCARIKNIVVFFKA